jgi:hypothetical protein
VKLSTDSSGHYKKAVARSTGAISIHGRSAWSETLKCMMEKWRVEMSIVIPSAQLGHAELLKKKQKK